MPQSIPIDGSLSKARALAGPNYTIDAGLGRQVGGNLFHSFGRFGLNTGESVNFTGPATAANIIGGVTGGSPSSIDMPLSNERPFRVEPPRSEATGRRSGSGVFAAGASRAGCSSRWHHRSVAGAKEQRRPLVAARYSKTTNLAVFAAAYRIGSVPHRLRSRPPSAIAKRAPVSILVSLLRPRAGAAAASPCRSRDRCSRTSD